MSDVAAAAKTSLPERLVSLDAFRGFTIVAMLYVNNPAYDDAFPDQFRHAPWGKFPTFCDMIFPWFLFIVGVALPYSAASFRKNNPGAPRAQYFLKAAKRAAILVFLGIVIDCSVAKRVVVGMNVLQLIGLAFFFATLLYELPARARCGIAAGLLVFYWVLIRFVSFPGLGRGQFEENANPIGWINDQLRPMHLAGIASVLPTAALVIIGTFLGDRFRDGALTAAHRLKVLFIAGAALAVAGLVWHLDLPMSKHVWTPSYILFTAGLGAMLLGLFYWIIDVKGLRAWAFVFVVFGMNAIAAYFVSIIVRIHTLQEWETISSAGENITLWQALKDVCTNFAGHDAGSWLFTTSYIFFWFLLMWWMYRRRIFWRV